MQVQNRRVVVDVAAEKAPWPCMHLFSAEGCNRGRRDMMTRDMMARDVMARDMMTVCHVLYPIVWMHEAGEVK